MKRLILLMILCVSSCGSSTKYRPEILGHDYKNLEIIKPKTYERVYCGDESFNKYASVSLKDLKKIALILKEAKIPWQVKVIVEELEKEVKRLEKAQ